MMDRERLIKALMDGRDGQCFPPGLRQEAEDLAADTLSLLFPHFAERKDCLASDVPQELHGIEDRLTRVLGSVPDTYPKPDGDIVEGFVSSLARIRENLLEDATALFDGDPAAESVDEVILVYPGFLATAVYRLAHSLHRLDVPLIPRIFAEWAHRRTGVDIHPGASIGRRFCIDHGTGVVIGETAEVGDDVKVYQGVTLGALNVSKSLAETKRHPTIEDRVVLYSQATILGGDTVVGRDSLIGGNVWLTESVPPLSVVTRPSEVRVRSSNRLNDVLDWTI